MKKKKRKIRFNYRHIIAVILTVLFLALSVFVFGKNIIRIVESCVDLYWSFLYYVVKVMGFNKEIEVTVNNYSSVPWTPFWGLPATWEEFEIAWARYWDIFFTKENFYAYLDFIGRCTEFVSRFILMAGMPIFLALYLFFEFYFKKQNNKYNGTDNHVTAAYELTESLNNTAGIAFG